VGWLVGKQIESAANENWRAVKVRVWAPVGVCLIGEGWLNLFAWNGQTADNDGTQL